MVIYLDLKNSNKYYTIIVKSHKNESYIAQLLLLEA